MDDTEPEHGNELIPLRVKPEHRPKGGRPAVRDIRALAELHTERAVAVLVSIAEDGAEHASARVTAAQTLLAYAHGKPRESIEVNVTEDVDSVQIALARLRANPDTCDALLLLAEKTALS